MQNLHQHIGLVYKIAHNFYRKMGSYQKSYYTVDDLASAGYIGLNKVKGFDANKGAFANYAWGYISNAIKDYLNQNRRIQIPRNICDIVYKEKNGISLSPYQQKLMKRPITQECVKQAHLVYDIEDKPIPKFWQKPSNIRQYLFLLSEREQYIITRKFGLDKEAPESIAEIAKNLNLSRNQVNNDYKKGLNNLKSFLEN